MNFNTVNKQTLLIGLIVVVAVFLAWRWKSRKTESFIPLSQVPVVSLVSKTSTSGVSNGLYEIPGNYQAQLNPRAASLNYGANISYNLPNAKNLALDSNDPLMMYKNLPQAIQNTNVEKYSDGSYKARSFKASTSDSSVDNLQYNNVTDMLPIQKLGSNSLNSQGEVINQPIIYDRFMYANQKSYLHGQADFIRGDLPIVPSCNDWFRPSVNPNIDLNSGALSAIGGVNNDTNKQLSALKMAASGNTLSTSSGALFNTQKSIYGDSAGGVTVTAFP